MDDGDAENLIYCPVCGVSVLYGKLSGIDIAGRIVRDQHRCSPKTLAAIDKTMANDSPRAKPEPTFGERLEIARIMNDGEDERQGGNHDLSDLRKRRACERINRPWKGSASLQSEDPRSNRQSDEVRHPPNQATTDVWRTLGNCLSYETRRRIDKEKDE